MEIFPNWVQVKPNCASQIDTAHHRLSTFHVKSIHINILLVKFAQNAKVVQLGTFFLCSHTQSLLFFFIHEPHDIGKSSFHCQPDNANVCYVVAFLPSIHWVRFFLVRWKHRACAMEEQQNNPGELPQYFILYHDILEIPVRYEMRIVWAQESVQCVRQNLGEFSQCCAPFQPSCFSLSINDFPYAHLSTLTIRAHIFIK